MATYRKLNVHEVGTDTFVDCDANVSRSSNDLTGSLSLSPLSVPPSAVRMRFSSQ